MPQQNRWHAHPRIRALLLTLAGALIGLLSASDASAQRYVALSTGSDHSCGVRETGEVFCWGNNEFGQLGDGSRTSRGIPVRVAGLESASAIAAGYRHSCAIVLAGKVKCWGSSLHGELGHGAFGESVIPVEATGITTAIAIGAGTHLSCALLAGGNVRCWGRDDHGQLGNGGTETASNVPVVVALGTNNATALAVGFDHACVRRTTGSVSCWGRNENGQVGDGTSGAANNRFTPVNVSGVSSAESVAAGRTHSCIVRTTGAVQCWGTNASGELGNDTIDSFTPRFVSGLSGVAQLGLGDGFSCARLDAGTVSCWGRNSRGQTGRPLNAAQSLWPTPFPVPGLGDVALADGGGAHTCALRSGGQILCWGNGSELGIGGTLQSNAPITVRGIDDATKVTVGSGFSTSSGFVNFVCALRIGGLISCWGSNSHGQLGNGVNGATLRSDSPVQVGGITNATEVKAGSNFACARIVNATVRCWGDGADGRLGNGTTTDSNVPVVVSNLTDAAQVAVGGSHACARRTGGSVVCWGSNASGQLGINVVGGSSTTPQPVTGITNASDIAAGRNNTCARLADNTVKCWGSNSDGQLGNGTTGGVSTVPVTVSGAVGTVANDALGIGTAHVCLRTTSTDLVCWGDNSRFELGNGAPGDSNVPVNVAITIATGRPALGSDHTCIRKPPSNTVLCWGDNDAGQVGDPEAFLFSPQPVNVFALSDTLDVAAGADSTCAVISDGRIRCWGDNASGLLGNGSPPPRPTPVPTPIGGNDSVCSLDIDGNGSFDALTDGVLLTRARFGLSGSAVTANALGLGAMRTDWESIRDYLQFNCNLGGLAP